MADNVSIFAVELLPEGWFSAETQADGWFDADLLDIPASGGGAISFVGGQVGGAAGRITDWASTTFALTGGSNSTPQAGDLVIIFYGIGTDNVRTPTPSIITPTDYTAGTLLTAVGTSYAPRANYFYKFMGGTPDTAFTLSQTYDIQDAGAVIVRVYRGVDPSTPIEAVVTSTATGNTAPNNKPNPASITPTTAGAWIVALGAQGAATSADFTAPAEVDSGTFQTYRVADTCDIGLGAGHYSGWTSGAYDIGPFAGGSNSAANGQCAYTLALKPAAGGGTTYDRQAAMDSVSTLTAVGVKTAGGQSRAAQIDSASSLTATATIRRNRQAATASASSLTVVATVRRNRQVVSASASSLAAVATIRRNRQAVISAVSDFAAVGSTSGQTNAAAVIAAASSLSVVAKVISRRAVVVGSASSVAVLGKVIRGRAVTVGSASTLTAVSRFILTRAVAINAVSAFDATPQAGQAPIRIYGDDGGEVIKRSFYDRQIKEFEDQLEAIAEAPKKKRAQAVKEAVEAFQPIQRVDYGPALNASARAILSGLRSLAETRMQSAERARVIAEIEADLALIKRKKRRNNEAALLLLM